MARCARIAANVVVALMGNGELIAISARVAHMAKLRRNVLSAVAVLMDG